MSKTETLALSEVAEFINGRAFKPSEWAVTGLPIIRIQNLTHSSSVFNRHAGTFNQRHFVQDGDLLVSWSATLDVFLWNRGPALLNQHIFKVVPDPAKVRRRFLFYALKNAMAELRSKTHGSTMKHITKTPFDRTRVPVPELTEQDRIVRLLDAAGELRQFRAVADRRIADLVPALFYEMFGDLSRNPHGSPILPFSELAQEFRYGTSTKSTGVGRPTLRIPNVIGNTLQLDDLKFVQVSEEEYTAWRLRDGDLVFVRTNGNADFIGRSAVFDSREISEAGHDPTEFIYASYLIRARLILDRIEPHYLQQYLRSKDARAEIRMRARTSAGQYNINTVGLGSIPVLVPPLLLQRQFAARVAEIRTLETQQAASRRRLDDLFQSMLHRAFRGKL